MRPRNELLLWLLFLTALYLLVRTARAEEAPCRRDGEHVICTVAGLKVLTDRILDTDVSLRTCQEQLRDAQGRMIACDKDCAVRAPVVPPAPAEPRVSAPASAAKVLTGASLVAIGATGLTLAAALMDVSGDWRAGLATVGVISLSIGVVMVLP